MKEDSALVFVAETKGLMEPPVIRKNNPSLTEGKMVGLRERDDQDKGSGYRSAFPLLSRGELWDPHRFLAQRV